MALESSKSIPLLLQAPAMDNTYIYLKEVSLLMFPSIFLSRRMLIASSAPLLAVLAMQNPMCDVDIPLEMEQGIQCVHISISDYLASMAPSIV
uniref:Uncharacterized protein n=1 Tax=Oryza punctata TaxID=4537 RepID=A0A0E0KM78_ORYPU